MDCRVRRKAGMKRKKILAIASGGGHWQQLMSMRQAFDDQDVLFVTTLAGLPEQYDAHPSRIVPDCNRNEKIAMVRNGIAMVGVMLRFRPQVVISTGALPGVIALALGRAVGARTIWVDSVANSEEMSMSGKLARRFAHLWLSQWEHVASTCGAEYAGSVL
ncbi:UDP-N-acetylglucosamine--LPS N-acetylglucosamine transferase [Meridianimarinicoccus roseus]|uniref:UDP-N-acetylglucosamine--LPS N-acetylglucosamine transferase n=2 Tax=Meridianimarinicoccus roseus TaxID=2072018 RepID=A0A2V2LFG4_9RHOB|nr:UDP-N-acetylglucosamine--LPS N-acetylglucosamine transferase [Meridianimarinicoccus roseus]